MRAGHGPPMSEQPVRVLVPHWLGVVRDVIVQLLVFVQPLQVVQGDQSHAVHLSPEREVWGVGGGGVGRRQTKQ